MVQRYLLELDGKLVGRFFRFDGGRIRNEVIFAGKPALLNSQNKAANQVDEVTLTCGTGMARSFYQWIGSTFDQHHMRKNVAIVGLDVKSNATFRMSFFDALITSLVLPELDRGSKNQAFMKLVFRPERVEYRPSAEVENLGVYTSLLPRAWHINSLRLYIDGLETERKGVRRIRPLTLGQSVKLFGDARRPQLEATKLSFSNIVVDFESKKIGGFAKWYAESMRGVETRKGALEFFAPGSSLPYFGVDLVDLALTGLREQQDGMVAELACERMRFSARAAAVK